MIDTQNWSRIQVDVLHDIQLDPKNVRLEIPDAAVEADIMEDLFANEDVLSLVEAICSIGYLTHEIPVVVERNSTWVVIEGNRRVAALKAIQNPMLVPEYQSRIKNLSKSLSSRDALGRIEVLVAPDQDSGDQLIAAIHTGNMRRPWTPVRQAAFFHAQLESGRTFGELVDRYPTLDVKRFVFNARILDRFGTANYDSSENADFLAISRWRRGYSTLSRIMESSDFSSLTSLALTEDGRLKMGVSKNKFDRIAEEIVEGMRLANINTRTINSVTSPRFKQLMTALHSIVKEETFKGAVPSESDSDPGGPGSDQPGRNSEPEKDGSSSRRPSKRQNRWLDCSQLTVPDSYPVAVSSLLGELSELDVVKFPNSTHLAIRAFLEKSIKAFADAKNADIKSDGFSHNGWVQLSNCLDWLENYIEQNGPISLKQPVRNLRSSRGITYSSSTDALNATNHNHHFLMEPEQVFTFWHSINSVLRSLMAP